MLTMLCSIAVLLAVTANGVPWLIAKMSSGEEQLPVTAMHGNQACVNVKLSTMCNMRMCCFSLAVTISACGVSNVQTLTRKKEKKNR